MKNIHNFEKSAKLIVEIIEIAKIAFFFFVQFKVGNDFHEMYSYHLSYAPDYILLEYIK